MNDILRTKYKELMKYGKIISDSVVTSDDNTTIARTMIIEDCRTVILVIMVNCKIINIIELWKSDDKRDTKK
jgi:hypothetical protein